jgi:hypothetical protein
MYFVALATDYDGTIAEDGVVAEATLSALRELKQSGRKLLLVTGRQKLPDLKKVLPEIALFDLVVARMGILFQRPARSAAPNRPGFLIGCSAPGAGIGRTLHRCDLGAASECVVLGNRGSGLSCRLFSTKAP